MKPLLTPIQIILDYALLALYCLLIFWLSAQSRLPSPDIWRYEDKIEHFAAYGVMACLAWRVFRRHFDRTEHIARASFTFCSLYGISDEWHQSFVLGRTSSALDWLADSFGALLALVLLNMLTARRYKMLSPLGRETGE